MLHAALGGMLVCRGSGYGGVVKKGIADGRSTDLHCDREKGAVMEVKRRKRGSRYKQQRLHCAAEWSQVTILK